jgi:ribonuclease HI
MTKSILDYFSGSTCETTKSATQLVVSKKTSKQPIREVSNAEQQQFLANFHIKSSNVKSGHVHQLHQEHQFHQAGQVQPQPAQPSGQVEQAQPIPQNKVRIYTDGSCINNGKSNAIGGFAVYFPGGEFQNIAEKYTRHPTNQRCELTAIYRAIQETQQHIMAGGKIEIYTDSEYSMKCLTNYCRKWCVNGWVKADKKPIENRDIIEPLWGFYSRYYKNIGLTHVRAHTGASDEHSRNNDIVDGMARQATFGNNGNHGNHR